MSKAQSARVPGRGIANSIHGGRWRLRTLCLTLSLFGAETLHAQTVSGIGTRRCEAFNRALEKNSEAAIDAYLAWGQGYISGVNTHADLTRDIQIDHGGLLHWLATQCKAAPRDLYVEALEAIVEGYR